MVFSAGYDFQVYIHASGLLGSFFNTFGFILIVSYMSDLGSSKVTVNNNKIIINKRFTYHRIVIYCLVHFLVFKS